MARAKRYFNPLSFYPLQKVMVTDTFGRGRPWKLNSLGYIVYILVRPDSYHQQAVVAFMRYGKAGKLRCDFNTNRLALLEVDKNLKGAELECVKDEILYKVNRHVDTALTVQLSDTKDLLKFKDIDFVIYLAAFSKYLNFLQGFSPAKRNGSPMDIYLQQRPLIRRDPGAAYDQIGEMEVNGPDEARLPDPLYLWEVISMLSSIGQVDGQDQFKRTLTFFKDKRIRTTYLGHMHKALCSLKNAVELYHKKIELDSSRSVSRAIDRVKRYIKQYR